MTIPAAIPKIPKFSFIFALTAFLSCSAATQASSIRDLDGDGIPNVSDRDVDNDGIPNKSDRNVDGGLCKTGLFQGKFIGDHLKNDSPKELDIDNDGRKDDAFGEKDIDGDGIEDQLDRDVDGDGRSNSVDDDIDGDGRKNKEDLNLDGDDYKNADDIDVDGDGLNNPVDPDIDGDGVKNRKDSDQDGDGTKNKKDRDDTGSENTGYYMILDMLGPVESMIPMGAGDFWVLDPIVLENEIELTFYKEMVADSPFIMCITNRNIKMFSPLGDFVFILDGFEYRTAINEQRKPVLVSVTKIIPAQEEIDDALNP